MTGPEHYREAERLAIEAMSSTFCGYGRENHLRAAQVHAALALAAATVATRAVGPQETWGGHAIEVDSEWQQVTS